MDPFIKNLVLPLVAIIIAVFVLVVVGQADLAMKVSYTGTMLVMFGNVAYIVLVDSRKRWPRYRVMNRLLAFLTFHRYQA